MLHRQWIVEPELFTAQRIVADLNAIRRFNPQRFEMEQLTAVVYVDVSRHICVGYKDLALDEFWTHSYVSRWPAMPATLMCESVSQLVNYYVMSHELSASPGYLLELKRVRCRRVVAPGERLFIAVKFLKIRMSLVVCHFQCVVQKQLVCHGTLIGGVLPGGTQLNMPVLGM
jgi:3-hydroxyacyl-[acyl-carrier-protein] dehydratase